MSVTYPLKIKASGVYSTLEQWDNRDEPDDSQMLEPGETVEYVAHVVGGMVKARRNGQIIILHPGCTKELS